MVERVQFMDISDGVINKLESESPELLQYSKDLYSRIQTEVGQVKYLRGLLMMTCLTNDRFYKYLTAATAITAQNNGMDMNVVEGSTGFNSAEVVNAGSITIARASKIAAAEKGEGKVIGLIHGHYRMFTPGSLLNVVLAGENCDFLLLGIERNWRTAKHKRVEPVYFDRLKENIMVIFPNLSEQLVAINRLAYTNQGYRRMVRTISPNIYFGNKDNPPELREEMAFRAELAGAEYHELDFIPSFSTREYLELGGSTDPNPSILLGN